MRIIHLGDLHFGKSLQNIQMTEADQPYWVDRFLDSMDDLKPDAVVIAGDIYDRKIPSQEAMKLWDRFITGLSVREINTFVIPGNHDSDIRLSHVGGLLKSRGIYIAGELKKDLEHYTITDAGGLEVAFWLMPYIFPRLVADRNVLDRDDLTSYDAACRALIEAQDVNSDACNVIVAHQNVLNNGRKPEHSDSETIIGGVGEIDYTAFDCFDYVALGHIHLAQSVGRETVRYAGCPMYYDFSEVNRWKGLTVVDIDGKDNIRIEKVEIPLLHTMRQLEGTFDELLKKGYELSDRNSSYFKLVIQDADMPARALEQLRAAYGDTLVEVKRSERNVAGVRNDMGADYESLPVEDEFEEFFKYQRGELLDGIQRSIVDLIADQQSRYGSDYVYSVDAVPADDTEELLRLILGKEASDETTQA